MANELTLLPNPDNTPGAVSSGYQRQNTNIFCIQTGLDTTEPFDNDSGTITIPAGEIVEVNGSLFKISANVSLTKQNSNYAYWIAVSPSGNSASLSLVTRPGTWNPAKQGFYRSDGLKTLNWVSHGTSISGSVGTPMYSRTTKGTEYVYLKKGWYYIELRSGAGGAFGSVRPDGDANAGFCRIYKLEN
jgi:hypothetical protein